MKTITTRRALLKAGPLAAAAVAAPASCIAYAATNPDADLIAAWDRRRAAYDTYNSLPEALSSEDGMSSPEEDGLWTIIDDADEIIRSTVAKTPRGVEIQIWSALYFVLHGLSEDDAAIHRGDLEYFASKERELNLSDRLALASIRSLRAMEA